MRRCSLRGIACLFSIGLFIAPALYAQNNRSAVSVAGFDTAACTVPDPCRTFGVALTKTNAGGEIVALTSGGYGPFTVDRSVTIVAAPGIYAALVASSGDAVLVNAGATAKVVIRGLHLYGMGTGNSGVSVTGSAAETHVENCIIDGFVNYGIIAFLNVRVSNTTIRRSGSGIWIDNSNSPVKGTINHVEIRDMNGGDLVSPGTGVLSWRNSNVTVRDTVVVKCTIGFRAMDGGQLNVKNGLATNSGTGIQADDNQGGLPGVVRVSNTMATDNTIGFLNSSGTFVSWGNNEARGNGTEKSGTITVLAQD